MEKFIVVILFIIIESYSYHTWSSIHWKSNKKVFSSLIDQTVTESRLNSDAINALDWVKNNLDKILIFDSLHDDDTSLSIREIGGGNTNFNYVVFDKKSNKSVFVKHAKPFAKGFGESAPMSVERLGYEYFGMNEFSKYGFTVPECYYYDNKENYLATSFLDNYEPFLISLQNLNVDLEIAQAIGAIMGHCHAGTHKDVIPEELSKSYQQKYQNNEHFNLWNDHFFPMATIRLKDTSLFQQADNIAKFGDKHYDFVRRYIEESRHLDGTCSSSCLLLQAVNCVNELYMTKKTTLIHGDLHANNIMIMKLEPSSNNINSLDNSLTDNENICSLEKVRLIDFEKFAYGPPGLDIAQYLTNYIYFMASVPVHSTKYSEFEEAIRTTWKSYVEAFDIHAEVQCRLHQLCILPDTETSILRDTLNDAVGFFGWWMFSLTSNCPVDVMPLTDKYDIERASYSDPNGSYMKNSIAITRENHLKIAVEALRNFALGKEFTSIDEVLSMIKEAIQF
jgi:5-methylthioribose kinase